CEYSMFIQVLLFYFDGNCTESVDCFWQCILLKPNSARNLSQTNEVFMKYGKHKAAIEVYNEAAKLNQKDWEIALKLRVVFIFLKGFQKVIKRSETGFH
uniref:Uncharacterized protein n=1 Tax=Macaca fascicularis TaxID=9541 RepID=A0A7N9CA75_MACFA